MSEPRIKTKIWVQAAIRRCFAVGIPATIVQKGDEDAGVVALKVNRLGEGCEVLTQARDENGVLGWYRATGAEPVPETDADAYIEQQMQFDRDLWVIEVEDRDGRHCFDGEVMD